MSELSQKRREQEVERLKDFTGLELLEDAFSNEKVFQLEVTCMICMHMLHMC